MILAGLAVGLLFWNEGRAVLRYKTLQEGGGSVISIESTRIDPVNEGRLVHVSGTADTKETLLDPDFGVPAQAIRLSRRVEMYQWMESRHSETRKKLGGGEETVTTYEYEPGWSEQLIDSRQFKKTQGHANPDRMLFRSVSWQADEITLGAFLLPRFLVDTLHNDVPFPIEGEVSVVASHHLPLHRQADGFYLGREPGQPTIGDMRISYAIVRPTEVSVISKQAGNTFQRYQTTAGGTIAMLEPGYRPAEEMFAAAQRSNTILTWALRAGGYLVMSLGFAMVLAPLVVIADVVPAIGSLLGAGTKFVSALLAGGISLITIGIAWLYYRPLLGIAFLVAAAGLVFIAFFRAKRATPVMPPPIPTAGTTE